LGPAVVSKLLRKISQGFSRESILQDKSPWEDKRETRVFSTAVSLVDDGNYPGGVFAAPFDMEGTPAQKTVLVDRGFLKTYLYDTYHATQENRLSTGNFVRSVDGESPHIGPTNLFIEPAATSFGELEAGIERGFSLQSVDEMDAVSQKPDERTLYCSGWRVENGKRTQPVRQVALNIDLRHVLESASQVGDDLTFYGSYGSPSILFENIL